MRRGLKYPNTHEEAKKRIRIDLAQIHHSSRHVSNEGAFDREVAYRVSVPAGAPPEMIRHLEAIQACYDEPREKLSARVARFYRRSGQISLVCDLLRQSPVFLRDQWVTDLLLERKRTALLDPDIHARRSALRDLQHLSAAIVSERLPSGQWQRTRKWRRLRADRPWKDIFRACGLINRYNCYVELATCLKQVRALSADDRLSGTATEESLSRYAEELQVPPNWLTQCWKGSTRPGVWALKRLAEDERSSAPAIRGRLEEAHRMSKQKLEATRRSAEATERLSPDRKRRAIQRMKQGGVGILRRY
jgi:hypothetical protein